ncbi:AAA family ATPase [Klebsiella pneumoniae]|nr:AAA family ATPase [Klebsiella pneumoniae]
MAGEYQSLRIGLCGAQGTGKTTLARIAAQSLMVPFIQTNVADILRRNGVVSCRSEMPVMERLALQEIILNGIVDALPREGEFITDRTPLDVMMYTLSWLPPFPDEEVSEAVKSLLDRCVDATDDHFSLITQLHPGIELPRKEFERTDRAPLNFACCTREDALLTGIIRRYSRFILNCRLTSIPVSVVRLDMRVNALEKLADINFAPLHDPFH